MGITDRFYKETNKVHLVIMYLERETATQSSKIQGGVPQVTRHSLSVRVKHIMILLIL